MTPTSAPPNKAKAAAKRERSVGFTPAQYWTSVAVLIVCMAGAVVAFVMVGGRTPGACPTLTQTSRPGNPNCYPISFHESRMQ